MDQTINTPTAKFRRIGNAFCCLSEAGDLLPGLHWYSRANGNGGYSLVQNQVGDRWSVDDAGMMYFFAGRSEIKNV